MVCCAVPGQERRLEPPPGTQYSLYDREAGRRGVAGLGSAPACLRGQKMQPLAVLGVARGSPCERQQLTALRAVSHVACACVQHASSRAPRKSDEIEDHRDQAEKVRACPEGTRPTAKVTPATPDRLNTSGPPWGGGPDVDSPGKNWEPVGACPAGDLVILSLVAVFCAVGLEPTWVVRRGRAGMRFPARVETDRGPRRRWRRRRGRQP